MSEPLVPWCRKTYGDDAPKLLGPHIKGQLDPVRVPGRGNKAARRLLAQTTFGLTTITPSKGWNWTNRTSAQRDLIAKSIVHVYTHHPKLRGYSPSD